MTNPKLEAAGAKWWSTADTGGTPNLSKANLGLFMYEVLKCGAEIGTVWPFNPNFDRSAVYFTVFMTDNQKQHLEAVTKFRFRKPQEIKLN